MGGHWINNQLISLRNNKNHNREFSFAVAVLGLIVLIHSWYLNGKSKNRVRVMTDMVGISCIIAGAGVFWSTIDEVTQTSIAFGCDLMSYGIAGTVVAMVDVMVTYSRLQLLTKPLFKHQDLAAGIYIFLLVVMTNISFYTWTPFFLDDNAAIGIYYLNIFLFYVFTPAIILFNCGLGFWFFYRIVGFRFSKKSSRLEQHPKMLMLAYKSCVHAFAR